jgi:hypothetical protein
MSILTPDGRQATPGPICLYMHAGGILYTPTPPAEDGADYVFDARRTVLILIQPNGVQYIRADKSFARPTELRVPRHGVARQNATDEAILTACADALSDLTVVHGGRAN